MLDLLRNYANSWSGELRKINITELRMYLKPYVVPFTSPPYRAESKTRKFERSKIDKQLQDGIIDPAMYKWAAQVLLIPKKDCKIRF